MGLVTLFSLFRESLLLLLVLERKHSGNQRPPGLLHPAMQRAKNRAQIRRNKNWSPHLRLLSTACTLAKQIASGPIDSLNTIKAAFSGFSYHSTGIVSFLCLALNHTFLLQTVKMRSQGRKGKKWLHCEIR